MSEEHVCDIIAMEISRFMGEDEYGLISSLRDQLISMMDECLRVLQTGLEANFLKVWELSFKEFDAYGTPYFFASRDPIISICWIVDV